jgi:hypothetical protein
MSINGINLARNLVWTARQRYTIYWAMLGYLLIASILLVFTASRATYKIQQGLDFKRQAQVLQKRFASRYPNQPGMEAYANLLKENLQKKAAQAAAINAALPVTIYSTLPLLNLLADPAQSGLIDKLSFAQRGKEGGKPELTFSVMIPEVASGAGVETPASLQLWRSDPVLVREFAAITPTTTERGNSDGEIFSILKYKAVFREY